MKPSQLRKRTDNIEGQMEQWWMRWDQATGLESAGRLLKDALCHMRALQEKVDNQAEKIRELEEKLKNGQE